MQLHLGEGKVEKVYWNEDGDFVVVKVGAVSFFLDIDEAGNLEFELGAVLADRETRKSGATVTSTLTI